MIKEVKYEGRFLRFIDENGWEYVERVNCAGIVIIVSQTDENNILFVEQYRMPLKSKTIEFPAGLIDDAQTDVEETCFQAAERELLEETGYKAGRLEVLQRGPVSGGMSEGIVTMLRAYDLKRIQPGGGVEGENITVHEISITKVDSWLKEMEGKGYFIEPKIYAGLYFLKGFNKE